VAPAASSTLMSWWLCGYYCILYVCGSSGFSCNHDAVAVWLYCILYFVGGSSCLSCNHVLVAVWLFLFLYVGGSSCSSHTHVLVAVWLYCILYLCGSSCSSHTLVSSAAWLLVPFIFCWLKLLHPHLCLGGCVAVIAFYIWMASASPAILKSSWLCGYFCILYLGGSSCWQTCFGGYVTSIVPVFYIWVASACAATLMSWRLCVAILLLLSIYHGFWAWTVNLLHIMVPNMVSCAQTGTFKQQIHMYTDSILYYNFFS